MRFSREAGMDPKNWQLERYKVCKDFRLPIEAGSSPLKYVDDKYKSIRELFSLNHGKFPLRLILSHKLRSSSFGR